MCLPRRGHAFPSLDNKRGIFASCDLGSFSCPLAAWAWRLRQAGEDSSHARPAHKRHSSRDSLPSWSTYCWWCCAEQRGPHCERGLPSVQCSSSEARNLDGIVEGESYAGDRGCSSPRDQPLDAGSVGLLPSGLAWAADAHSCDSACPYACIHA